MSEKEKIQVAKEYIDKQLQTMKTHGCAPKSLSPGQYKSMITEVAKTILK
ncbi:MAG: hypothetical protein JWM54_1713 [Acidobacteriaceae bacterium]|nr:hypothetical protein [Acidobacteriaceae bacterium]